MGKVNWLLIGWYAVVIAGIISLCLLIGKGLVFLSTLINLPKGVLILVILAVAVMLCKEFVLYCRSKEENEENNTDN